MEKNNLHSLHSKKKIRKSYESLLTHGINPQKRGYELEKLMRLVLENEEVEPKASYRKTGEQIDGSFFWMGQTFLFEVKWEKNKISTNSIYTFKGKVDGKFHTSNGIFIAMNGYTDDTEQALLTGKISNVLLFDGEDMALIFRGYITFLEVLKFKLRAAGDTGALYSRYSLLAEINHLVPSGKENAYVNSSKISDKPTSLTVSDLLVFVEGNEDLSLAKSILDTPLKKFSLSYNVIVLGGANGILSVPTFVSTYQGAQHLKGVIILLDDDINTKKFQPIIEKVTEQLTEASIWINHLVIYIAEDMKSKYSDPANNRNPFAEVEEKLDDFLANTVEEYYDPEEFVLSEVLYPLIEDLDWDETEKRAYHTDDYTGMPSSIENLEELVEYLNNILVEARLSDMPLELMKELDSVDYSWEIREYLEEYYHDKLNSLGWL